MPSLSQKSLARDVESVVNIAWLTDIHLDHLNKPGLWWKKVVQDTACDAFLITGDIWNADHTSDMLSLLASAKKPVYFILGNHDYYGGSIQKIRMQLRNIRYSGNWDSLRYLGNENVIELTPKTSLVGDDGWYDGRNGDYRRSDVNLNDFYFIGEFNGLNRNDRLAMMRKLTDSSAARLGELCKSAIAKDGLEHLIVATHVPPFAGAAWHMGQPSGENFQPFFSNRTVGTEILDSTKNFRDAGGKVTVLCGHSHSDGEIYPGRGMTVRTGRAVYGRPAIYDILEIT